MNTLTSPMYIHYLVIVHLILLPNKLCKCDETNDNPDIFLSSTGIIRRHGYPSESHTVQTEDGYILNIHRIPHGQNEWMPKGKKPVVFLQHGTLSSSSDWILAGPKKSLGFILADAGYDVWIGNARGNTYSVEHMKFKSDSDEFWDFSWDQLALYDLPAEIDYILQITGQPDLTYIGHSLGGTIAFAMIATYPEYNKKINVLVGMAPAVYVSHTKTPVRYSALFAKQMSDADKFVAKGRQLSQDKITAYLDEKMCGGNIVEEELCSNLFFFLGGIDKTQINESLIPAIVSHTPAGTSSLVGVQYAQQVFSERFCRYDFGFKKNMETYNSILPPLYPLENIKLPVAIIYSENDMIVTPTDIHITANKLANVVEKYLAPPNYNHFDYIYAMNAHIELYPTILRIMQNFSNKTISNDINKTPFRLIRKPRFFWKNWFN